MRDIERIDAICARLADAWKKQPDWRFCQIINNFFSYIGSDGFYLEDEDFIKRFEDYMEKTTHSPH